MLELMLLLTKGQVLYNYSDENGILRIGKLLIAYDDTLPAPFVVYTDTNTLKFLYIHDLFNWIKGYLGE